MVLLNGIACFFLGEKNTLATSCSLHYTSWIHIFCIYE
jgi:hypothetical protein